jgi:AcrR family transcriptional regulator
VKRAEAATARERPLAVASELFYRSFPSKDELVAAYLRGRDEKYWDGGDTTTAPSRCAARAIASAQTFGSPHPATRAVAAAEALLASQLD